MNKQPNHRRAGVKARCAGLAGWALVFACLAGCAASSGPFSAAVLERSIERNFSAPLLIDLGKDGIVVAEKGAVLVPERREVPDSALLSVAYVRVPSAASDPATPVFWLFGGPGSSSVKFVISALEKDAKGEGDDNERAVAAMFKDMLSVADIVLMEQRGTGASSPVMNCPTVADPSAEDAEHEGGGRAQPAAGEILELMRRCAALWEEQGRSLRGYNAFALADDLDDVRKALGYERVTLYGISFGSQLAFTTLRRRPEAIERVLLNGLEDTDHTFDMPSEVLASIRRIIARLGEHPEHGRRLPQGDVVEMVRSRIDSLREAPVRIELEHAGEPVGVVVTADDLRAYWWRPLHGRPRQGLDAFMARIAELEAADYSGAAREKLDASVRREPAVSNWPWAMYYGIDCSLSPSAERRARLLADPAQEVIGRINDAYFAVCDGLGLPTADAAFLKPLSTSTPALFFHGDWDTSTPLENARAAAAGFADHKLIIVRGGRHAVLRDLYALKPDTVSPIVRAFLRGEPATHAPDEIDLPLSMQPVWRAPQPHVQDRKPHD